MADVARRRRGGVLSSSEKITGAKNAQADALLQRLLQQFQTESRKVNAEQHATSERVTYELQVLNLERQCSELDMRRRLNPVADYSHEEGTVLNLRKYLARGGVGGNDAAKASVVYADKRLTHKIRTVALPDSRSPAVTQAQAAMRKRRNERAFQRQKSAARSSPNQRRSRSGNNTDHTANERTVDRGLSSGSLVTRQIGRKIKFDPRVKNWHSEDESRSKKAESNLAGDANLFANMDKQDPDEAGAHTGGTRWPGAGNKSITGGSARTARTVALQKHAKLRPVTMTMMRDCWRDVQARVDAFCFSCDRDIWQQKEKELASLIKYSKEKDLAWATPPKTAIHIVQKHAGEQVQANKIQAGQKARRDDKKPDSEDFSSENGETTDEEENSGMQQNRKGIAKPALSRKQKYELILRNILLVKPFQEHHKLQATMSRNGMPSNAATRTRKHSSSTKLRMLTDRTRTNSMGATGSNAGLV